ncbi:MAG: hypothetical protein K2Y01_05095 [Rhabdochlamydiaceae bacterium]|nr:hypothetical protein [Rhabdochlamydiaceae bacterium]
MNSIQNYMDKYSKDLNDYGTYLSPLGTMLCTGLFGDGVNTTSSAISVAINQLGLKTADKLESNKSLVNRAVAVFSAVVVTTVAQSYIYQASGNNFAITCLVNLGLFLATFKGVESSNPVKIIPYVRLPATIALSCMVGEVARKGFMALGVSAQNINQTGGFLTLLAVCSVALNDIFYKNTAAAAGNTSASTGPRPYVLKDVQQEVRQLPSGRILIMPKKADEPSQGAQVRSLQTQILPVRTQ